MSEIDDGGPAFPLPDSRVAKGMSLRDYFAASVLQGWIATYGEHSFPAEEARAQIATRAYQMADAMLKAREVQS